MVWPSSAQGTRPPRTPDPPSCLQTSYLKLAKRHFLLPLFSISCTLFCSMEAEQPFSFQFFANSFHRHGACTPLVRRSGCAGQARSFVVVPSTRRWRPVVFSRETPSIPFIFISLPGSFLLNEGGYVHPLLQRGSSTILQDFTLCLGGNP